MNRITSPQSIIKGFMFRSNVDFTNSNHLCILVLRPRSSVHVGQKCRKERNIEALRMGGGKCALIKTRKDNMWKSILT